MAESDRDGTKWLRYGCIGCLGIVALGVLILLLTFGTAWMGVRSEQVAERDLEPELPGGPSATGEAAEGSGRVVLRLSSGEFLIRPARRGEPLHVRAVYDERTYDLQERFDPGGEHWTYEVDFTRTGSMLMSLLKGLLGGTGSRVEVYLPADVPLELDLQLNQGGSEIDLGGLWLTAAEIDVAQGGFKLTVSEPLRQPMDSLEIRGSMGGFLAERLGNASPRRLDVEYRMGGMELDLRGKWVADSEISIRGSQGGGGLRLPRDVEIVGLDTGRVRPLESEDLQRPRLTFSVSTQQGELEIVE